jgi:crossover junction endodeoxyribonuclease RuvC
LRLTAFGVIRPPAGEDFHLRLLAIHRGLAEVIQKYSPDEAAVEGVFAAKNVRSALKLGQARGVALLAAALAGIPVFEYTPAEVKKALVGVGRAEKEQVRVMVRALLKTREKMPLDASDALAVAVTHLHSRNLRRL